MSSLTTAAITSTAPATTTTTASVTTTTAAADAAPLELAGVWDTDRNDQLRLILSGTSYTLLSALGRTAGDISVEGDLITFSNCDCSEECLRPGTYQWLIEGDSLTLTEADPVDPCSGRLTRLAGVAYTR